MRQKIRLYSGLILMAFVTMHLINHIGGIVSLKTMDVWKPYLSGIWGTFYLGTILIAAFTLHIANAVYSVYIRATLKLQLWEALQLGLGLAIPILLASHFTGAFIGQIAYQYDPTYQWIVTYFWNLEPGQGVLQGLGMVVAWVHGCIGIHFWLRLKTWYPSFRFVFATLAISILCLSGSGFIAAGIESMELAKDSQWARSSFKTMNMDAEAATTVGTWLDYAYWAAAAGILLPFGLRLVRISLSKLDRKPVASTPTGVSCKIATGATLLEALQAQGIPHAAVCGGRGRCTTCRVRVLDGIADLVDADDLETKALQKISAPVGVRLACQIKPASDIKFVSLLPPNASASDGRRPGGLEGQEQSVTAMFVDLRGSTKLGEDKLPYDVLFILNQFFAEMTAALRETNGHYAQFAGDGLLALYGLNRTDPIDGIRDAIKGAIAMHRRLADLNESLSSELAQPLKIGIGINYGDAIVGLMGPPDSQLLTAIGDSINTAARLENQSKQHEGATIFSEEAIKAAGLALDDGFLHEAQLRGRQEFVKYFAVPDLGMVAGQVNISSKGSV